MGLAWHHPLWPVAAVVLGVLWAAGCAWWPGLWLFALPAALPVANLAPWTGWVVFDEFDLLLLATLAGCYGRLALRGCGTARLPAAAPYAGALLAAVAANSVLALYRGFADAGWAFGWYQSYAEPLNSLRAFKGPAFALALWPLLRRQLAADTPGALQRLCLGMLVGVALVSLAVLWERLAHTGLWDFSAPYRTTALFWEMHVGGAAIDAYLAIGAPFVAWALWAARSPAAWAGAAALALAVLYAALTTFSRGVYLSVGVPLLLLGLLLLGRRLGFRTRALWLRAAAYAAAVVLVAVTLFGALQAYGLLGVGWVLLSLLLLFTVLREHVSGWRSAAGLGLLLALLMEVVAVFGTGNFMLERLSNSQRDFGSRLTHWQNGLNLLHTPGEWAGGIGLGRLPSSYARFTRNREFSGTLHWSDSNGLQTASLAGPKRQRELGGLFSMTQRVPLRAAGGYRVEFDVRVESTTVMSASVCETHLLYDGRCQFGMLRIRPSSAGWQRVAAPLDGPPLSTGRSYAPRMGVFALSVLNAGAKAEIDNVQLMHQEAGNLLKNADFSRELAHWLPAARYYFLPWHIDNLYLELLIERGLAGLLLFVLLSGLALRRLSFAPACGHPVAPFLAASLVGGLTVGMVSSVMDVPRVAFLLFLLLQVALSLDAAESGKDKPHVA